MVPPFRLVLALGLIAPSVAVAEPPSGAVPTLPTGFFQAGVPDLPLSALALDPRGASLAVAAARGAPPSGGGHVVVAAREGPDGLVSLVAASARDGRTLWEWPSEPASFVDAWTGAGDLDGDGAPDVVARLLALGEGNWTADCVGALCRGTYSLDWRWTLQGHSGATGRLLWHVVADGGYVSTSAWTAGDAPAGGGHGHVLARDLALDVATVPDVTGDGVGDVIVNAVSLGYASAHAGVGLASPGAGAARWTTRATVVDGATGGTSLLLQSVPDEGLAWLSAAGRLDAGPAGDLVWSHPSGSLLAVTALGGGAFAPLWASVHPRPEGVTLVAVPLGDDVTGDARADVALHAIGPGPHDRRLALASGSDGRVLWSGVEGGPIVLPLALDGARGIAQARSAPVEGGTRALVERLSPIDGAVIAAHELFVPSGPDLSLLAIGARATGPVTEHPGGDVLLQVIDAKLSFETWEWTVQTTLRALDGDALATEDERIFPGVAYATEAGPLDDAPGTDFLVTLAASTGSTALAWSPGSRSLPWTSALLGPAAWRAALADATGDGRPDLAVTVAGDAGESTHSLDGRTGAPRWSAPGLSGRAVA